MMEIPEDIVPKFFIMDPETDDLLPNANHLMNGMIVLIEDSSVRIDTSKVLADWEEERADERNFWCRVSYLDHNGPYDNTSSFIAEYHDGTKKKRTYNKSHAWFVKKDSIEDAKEVFDESNKPLELNPFLDLLRRLNNAPRPVDSNVERDFANYEHSEDEEEDLPEQFEKNEPKSNPVSVMQNVISSIKSDAPDPAYQEQYTEKQVEVREILRTTMLKWSGYILQNIGEDRLSEPMRDALNATIDDTLEKVIQKYSVNVEDSDEVERYERVSNLVFESLKKAVEVTSVEWHNDHNEPPASFKDITRETVLDIYKEF